MTVVGLDHVQLAMPAGAEDAARGFYAGVLGLVELTKPPVLAARGGCWFGAAGGAAPLGLVHLGVEDGFTPARKAHPGLRVGDLAALRSRLADAGVATVADDAIPGEVRCYVADPFGNRVELLQA